RRQWSSKIVVEALVPSAQKEIAGYACVPGDLKRALLFFLRRTGGASAALGTLAGLHFDVCGRHRVCDCHLFADLKVARDLSIGITTDFPAVLSLLDRYHRVRYLQDRSSH